MKDETRTATGRLLRWLLPLVCLPVAACETLSNEAPPPPYPPVVSMEMGAMKNVSRCGNVWLGSIPGPVELDLASRRGIKTLFDLRTPDERGDALDLSEAGEACGLAYFNLSLEGSPVPDALVDVFLQALAQAESEQVLLFCGNGSRCALLFAVQRVIFQDVPLETALADARSAGVKPGAQEGFVRAQVERLSGAE